MNWEVMEMEFPCVKCGHIAITLTPECFECTAVADVVKVRALASQSTKSYFSPSERTKIVDNENLGIFTLIVRKYKEEMFRREVERSKNPNLSTGDQSTNSIAYQRAILNNEEHHLMNIAAQMIGNLDRFKKLSVSALISNQADFDDFEVDEDEDEDDDDEDDEDSDGAVDEEKYDPFRRQMAESAESAAELISEDGF